MKPQIQYYIEQLKEANKQQNLYSASAYNQLEFHIHSSINLAEIITNTPKIVIDIGSGNGLPSIIVALYNPNNTIYAFESKKRKCEFISKVANEMGLTNIVVKNVNVHEVIMTHKSDIITAKGFKKLAELARYYQKWQQNHASMIIPVSNTQLHTNQHLLKNMKSKILERNGCYYVVWGHAR